MHFDPSTLQRPAGLFVGGQLVEAHGDDFVISCPSQPSLKFPVGMATPDDMDRAVETCRAALKESGWRDAAPRDRGRVLNKWADLVDEHASEIAALEAVASSRPYSEAMTRDVKVVSIALRTFSSYAETHVSDVTATGARQLSMTRDEPHGVVGAISPWNFPVILSAWKFAPALAAGNGVVLKPSEFTPFAILRIAELGRQAGLPDGLFNVVLGDGSVGQTLVRHPGVDYVTFTGSSRTGAMIMADAAMHGLKPVSLELGGKGPHVVFDSASNLEKIADMVARGVTYNSGQACFSGSRLVVQSTIKDELLALIRVRMQDVTPGPTWEDGVTLPPVINQAQLERMSGIVDRSVEQGGTLLLGGQIVDGDRPHFEPTILDGIGQGNAAFDEEIFGPVLAVDTFDTFDDAITKANHPEYGLTASVWTQDIDIAMEASHRLESGTVWINHWGRSTDMTAPFGGVKRSGIGKDMGKQGYAKYLKSKAVWLELNGVS